MSWFSNLFGNKKKQENQTSDASGAVIAPIIVAGSGDSQHAHSTDVGSHGGHSDASSSAATSTSSGGDAGGGGGDGGGGGI